MVSEDTSVIVPNIHRTSCQRNISSGKKMSRGITANEDATNTRANHTINNERVSGNPSIYFVETLINEICDNVFKEIQAKYLTDDTIVIRRNKNFKEEPENIKAANRNTYILENGLFMPSNSLITQLHNGYNGRRAISECRIDENDNNDYSKVVIEAVNENVKICRHTKNEKDVSVVGKPSGEKPEKKKKKKLSFHSLFGKKEKKEKEKPREVAIIEPHAEVSETYDNFEFENVPKFRSNTLGRTKKYASAVELNQKSTTLQRTPSFIRKLVNIGEDSTSFLKRSLSFRDVDRKKVKGKLTVTKKHEWKESLQSLVENDTSVSYNDLSFVDYDALNNINYETRRGKSEERPVCRTRSMIEKRSYDYRQPALHRGTSINDSSRSSNTCLAEQSGALSLPSLHHSSQDYAENSAEASPSSHRYRRRPQSISSEDGGGRVRPRGNGSFRSAGNGCAKLKRHNACRQKSRTDVASLPLHLERHREAGNNDQHTVSHSNINA